jgi:type II secretion system protein G
MAEGTSRSAKNIMYTTYMKKGNGGFTLIELLVVIAIIGLLASIVMTSLGSARKKAQDAVRGQDVRAIKTALELYSSDFGGYPTSAGTSNGAVPLSDATLVGKLVPKYLPSMPALLVADGDQYYTAGITTGVNPNAYDMYIILGDGTACKSGVNIGPGDWGISTLCPF